jgi:hypothetical protein
MASEDSSPLIWKWGVILDHATGIVQVLRPTWSSQSSRRFAGHPMWWTPCRLAHLLKCGIPLWRWRIFVDWSVENPSYPHMEIVHRSRHFLGSKVISHCSVSWGFLPQGKDRMPQVSALYWLGAVLVLQDTLFWPPGVCSTRLGCQKEWCASSKTWCPEKHCKSGQVCLPGRTPVRITWAPPPVLSKSLRRKLDHLKA